MCLHGNEERHTGGKPICSLIYFLISKDASLSLVPPANLSLHSRMRKESEEERQMEHISFSLSYTFSLSVPNTS